MGTRRSLWPKFAAAVLQEIVFLLTETFVIFENHLIYASQTVDFGLDLVGKRALQFGPESCSIFTDACKQDIH